MPGSAKQRKHDVGTSATDQFYNQLQRLSQNATFHNQQRRPQIDPNVDGQKIPEGRIIQDTGVDRHRNGANHLKPVVMFTEDAVKALRTSHLVFLQMLAAELAQTSEDINFVKDGHVASAFQKLGFSGLCQQAEQALLSTASYHHLSLNAGSCENSKLQRMPATRHAESPSTRRKRTNPSSTLAKKRKKKAVVTKEMEEEQARLFEASLVKQKEMILQQQQQHQRKTRWGRSSPRNQMPWQLWGRRDSPCILCHVLFVC